MHFQIQLIAIIFSVCLIGIILEMVRKKRLREEYSLIWLLAGVSLLILSLNRGIVEKISIWMGVSYAPSALFVVALFFGMLLAIHFSLILSQLTEKVRILAQQNALLHLEISDLQGVMKSQPETIEPDLEK